jgi:hypothetical protein
MADEYADWVPFELSSQRTSKATTTAPDRCQYAFGSASCETGFLSLAAAGSRIKFELGIRDRRAVVTYPAHFWRLCTGSYGQAQKNTR